MKEISGYVRMSIDKLQGIRGDLVRTDDNWREWDFPKLVEALRKWTERNPVELELNEKPPDRKKPPFLQDRSFQALQKDERAQGCVYCIVRNLTTDPWTAKQLHQLMSANKWRGNHPPLPSNEVGSLRQLGNLVRKLRSQGTIERYDQVIQDQIEAGIVERVSGPVTGRREFYIPHKPVLRESAETTKLRVVYDASARANSGAPSLNECLNPGPPLQNQLWNVLVRAHFHPVTIAGDIKQTFLRVRIREEDRDALRFHWLKDLNSQTVEALRFTRALFGLTCSPFLLGGVIQHLLESCREKYPEIVREIERSLYVDDLISGGPTQAKAETIKSASVEIFAEGTFELHKWHSNVKELETTCSVPASEEETYAKEQLVPQGRRELLYLVYSGTKRAIPSA